MTAHGSTITRPEWEGQVRAWARGHVDVIVDVPLPAVLAWANKIEAAS